MGYKEKSVDDWAEVKFGDVLKYEQPYRYAVEDPQYNEQSGTPVLTAGKSFILGYTSESTNVYQNLPVIIFDDFTTDSKYVDFPFKVKSSAMKFLKEKNKGEVDLKFMFEVLQSIKLQTVGGDHKRRWISEFSKIKIKAPGFPQQTRIAQILSKADAAIAQTEALIAKYQRIKTGLMQDLLTKGIDEAGNIRSKQTHRFVVKNGFEVPEEWEVVRLKDCVTPGTTITYGIVQTGLHRPDGVRVLRTVDLKEDYIDASNLLRTSPEISNLFKRTILKEGDLVCNVRASVGDFNIVPKELEGVNTTRGVARISPKKEINNRYLLWFLKSETNKRQMELLIKGTTFIDINIADLREIFVCIPREKREQDEIANNLEAILKKIKVATLSLSKLQSLKTGLMRDLLSGKVRVNIKEETYIS
jgi:type I restriction enzyme S subunit